MPANQALNAHPEFDYDLVETERGLLILAADLRRRLPRALRAAGQGASPPCKGAALELHRASAIRSTTACRRCIWATTSRWRPAPASSTARPAYGMEDFDSCRAYGMKDDEILNAGAGRRPLRGRAAALRRPEDLEGQPAGRREAARGRRAARTRSRTRTATCTAGATRRRSSTARRTQWFAGMDERARLSTARSPPRRCARRRCAASRRRAFYPDVGQGAPARHDRQPARLDAVAPAPVGRADAVLHPQGDRRAASAHAGAARSRSRKRVEQGGIEAWQTLDAEGTARRRRRRSTEDHATRSTSGSTRARRTRR